MNSIQKGRRAQAAVLTAISVATVVAIGAVFGLTGFLLSALTLPLPLTVLWLASDVLRSDEKALAPRPIAVNAREELPQRTVDQAA